MNDTDNRYFIIYKPRDMVSQFVSSHKVNLLGDLLYTFPEGTHAIGRLDNNSEGLLLLTTNKKVTRLLFESDVPHKRSYLVQVRHVVTEETIQQLKTGVSIRVKGGGDYITAPCEASIVKDPTIFVSINNEIKEYYPSSWIMITLTEGKFRQVRKMVAAVRHQCIRLIRVSIEDMKLQDLQPGEVKEINEKLFFENLKI
ncbi:pseudouridine synthase [Segetibacter koreensis]|uniref:pseudouridine synthase n=1 Tax=Segetibacter koreensis TaxID=398037 RepID=UPI0003721BE8|nr:pseudouridine synthase [Segetibacter koreensis]